MFDPKDTQEVVIRIEGGAAIAAMKFPTDDQWLEWRSKKKLKSKAFGRGTIQPQAQQPGPMDLALLRAIFQPEATTAAVEEAAAKGEKFLPYAIPEDTDAATEDASHFIAQLAKCRVVSEPEREGDIFTITLKVPGGHITKHRLREPLTREQHLYERALEGAARYGQYGVSETIINLRPPADLYDKIMKGTEGYSNGSVPIIHKAEAIAALMGEIRPADEENDPE